MLKDERYFTHMSGRTHVTGHLMCNGFVVSKSIQQNMFSSCHSNHDSLRLDLWNKVVSSEYVLVLYVITI